MACFIFDCSAFECGKVTSCQKNDLGLCPYFIYEPKHCLCLLRENKRKTNRFIFFLCAVVSKLFAKSTVVSVFLDNWTAVSCSGFAVSVLSPSAIDQRGLRVHCTSFAVSIFSGLISLELAHECIFGPKCIKDTFCTVAFITSAQSIAKCHSKMKWVSVWPRIPSWWC